MECGVKYGLRRQAAALHISATGGRSLLRNRNMMVEMRVAPICLFLALLAGCAPPPAPPDPQLWGSLKPGPYGVGFGLRWETDPSRVYGLEKDGVTKKPRPIP